MSTARLARKKNAGHLQTGDRQILKGLSRTDVGKIRENV
jgi:hypothetical protein